MTCEVCFDLVIIFSRYQEKNIKIKKLLNCVSRVFIFWKWDLDALLFYIIDSCNGFCLLVKVVFDGVPVLLVNRYVYLLHSAAAAAACRPRNKLNSQSSSITNFTNLKLNIYQSGYMMYWYCTGQYIWKHMMTYWRLQEDVSLKLNFIIFLIYD